MDRRRILLVVAVVVALLGTALVFLYVRGADARAEDRFDTVDVLRAVAPIEAGETIDDAAANGKLALAAGGPRLPAPQLPDLGRVAQRQRRHRPHPAR